MSQAELPMPAASPRRFRWRRLFQYRLRTLLILTAVLAAGLGWWSHNVWRQRQAVAALRQLGATVRYDFEPFMYDSGCFLVNPKSPPNRPVWLVNLLGVDHFATADRVRMPEEATDDNLFLLRGIDRLKALDLGNAQVTDAGLTQLRNITQLESLGLGRTKITLAGLRHFAAVTRLKGLDISGMNIADSDLQQIRELTSLEYLSIRGINITDDGLKHLRGIKSLKSLVLHCPQITDAGLEHLEGLSQLNQVSLDTSSYITDAGVDRLKLRIPQCYINRGAVFSEYYPSTNAGYFLFPLTDADLQLLNPNARLKSLSLDESRVTDAGLARLKGMISLKSISLSSSTHFTDAGLASLTGLTGLENLDLSETHVTDAALEHLKTLVALKNLDLMATKVTGAGVRKLQEALPKCMILCDVLVTTDDEKDDEAAP